MFKLAETEAEKQRELRVEAESRRSRIFKPIRAGEQQTGRGRRPLNPFQEKIDFREVLGQLRPTSAPVPLTASMKSIAKVADEGSRGSSSGIPAAPAANGSNGTSNGTTKPAAVLNPSPRP